MESKVILLNGPAGCGKSELVKFLKEDLDLVERRAKDKLFRLTMEFFSVDEDDFWEIYNDRLLKESPSELFTLPLFSFIQLENVIGKIDGDSYVGNMAVSIREAMIFVSECICKPYFGKDFFGKARAWETPLFDEISIDDSAGFEEELPPLIERIGQDNILLIRVKGRGDFQGDSRSYIPDGVIENTVDIWNTGKEEDFQTEAREEIRNFLTFG